MAPIRDPGAADRRREPILLINPNTSLATTRMMVAICRRAAPAWANVEAATAACGPTMIVDEAALAASASEVVRIGLERAARSCALIVGAFGDPGLDVLRERLALPVVGICEASMIEAAADGRRFGVATVTPGLVAAIDGRAAAARLAGFYTGTRLTDGDPLELAREPQRLGDALAVAIQACIRLDGAEAVIIGGGPLAAAAEGLQGRFAVPIVAPLPAAMRLILQRMSRSAPLPLPGGEGRGEGRDLSG